MPEIKGIVGEKLGMTQIFVDTRAVPVTVIKAGPCVVTQIRTEANDGYDAVQLAYGTMRPRDVSKPTQGHVDKGGAGAARPRGATSSSSAPPPPAPTRPDSRSPSTPSPRARRSTWSGSPRARASPV